MKAPLFMLAAAALSLTAAAADARPRADVDNFLAKAQAQAESKVAAAGVNLATPVRLEAQVDSDGHLRAAHVIGTSGSRDTDYSVQQAMRQVRLDDVPPVLIGAKITLALGHEATLAKAP